MSERTNPEQLYTAANVVPPADGNLQKGRPAPSQLTYTPGQHQVVDIKEAQRRMAARAKGELPQIPGPFKLNPPTRNTGDVESELDPATMPEPSPAVHHGRADKDFDPLSEDGNTELVLSAEDELELSPEALAEIRVNPPRSSRPVSAGAPARAPAARVPERGASQLDLTKYARLEVQDQYLKQRQRMKLQTSGGTMVMTGIALVDGEYSVTMLLPCGDGSATFIPDPGSEVAVGLVGKELVKCYFPGTYFELPELGLMALVFVKVPEN